MIGLPDSNDRITPMERTPFKIFIRADKASVNPPKMRTRRVPATIDDDLVLIFPIPVFPVLVAVAFFAPPLLHGPSFG